jgi:plastocyanin
MKWTFAASLAVAQVALAKSVHNVYPVNFDVRSPNRESNNRGDNNRGGVITNTVIEETIIILWVNPGNGAATTTLATNAGVTATAVQNGQTASAVAPPGAAQTHNVTVGGPGGLAYSPDSISAAVGDTVIFTFLSQNHTVSQSAFATPCELLAGGMDTGFQPNPNNSVNPPPKVAMQVMSSGPLCEL